MANIQFNSKDAKGFRTVCAAYYKARHEIAETVAKARDGYNAAKSIYDMAVADKADMESGDYTGHRTPEKVDADIAVYGERMNDFKAVMTEAKAKHDNAISAGLALYTEAMHKAAAAVVTGFGSDDSMLAWRTALADMLIANGVKDATPENVARFDFAVNAKSMSDSRTVVSGVSVGVGARSQSAKLFANLFTEYLVNEGLITPFKHKYIPVAEQKRLERIAARAK